MLSGGRSVAAVKWEEQTLDTMQGQCLATLVGCGSWIKRGSGCVCMCVKVCRLIEYNQNEKCGLKKKNPKWKRGR